MGPLMKLTEFLIVLTVTSNLKLFCHIISELHNAGNNSLILSSTVLFLRLGERKTLPS